ncbi:MAG TPA: patatin-like phospholipase family protein [Solirubrobacteraceae bacterium]|nr:patatin-like phospholipase family protein [Solirubrobacteraceae bacterium]
MGKVVKLDPQAKDGSRPKNARRPKGSKTALVLGGGGFTGGVYEIGALRALDLLTVNRTVNDFDVYVGTSAGAFVAAMTANGVTPEEMMRVVTHQRPTPFPDADLGNLLRPNLAGFARSAIGLPLRTVGVLRGMIGQLGQVSAMDLMLALADGLPSGAYTGSGIEAYLQTVLSDPSRSDDFRQLAVELYLTATDLDTCERIVFGDEGWDDIPISTAVRASTALPMVYAPVKVRDRELVDGGIVSTTNLDIAVNAGAKFIVVVNPLVPYVNDFKTKIKTLSGTRTRHVSDMGFPQIGYQAFKMVAYQRLHEMARQWEQRYPGVDIILIEPEPDDELMFQTPIMNFTSRVEIARHGFQSVTTQLAFGYPRFREICKRHGIQISATRVRNVMKHFEAEQGRTRAWRKILEQTTGALLRQSADEQTRARP